MKKAKYIFVVTTIHFGYLYRNVKRSGDRKYHSFEVRTNKTQRKEFSIVRERTWGWYSTFEQAKYAVEQNACDMYEDGYYNHALIEETSEGVCAYDIKETWYKWKGTWRKGGYKPATKPKEYHNVIGFMDRIKPKAE